MSDWPEDLSQMRFYMVGIKGTGMCALAELLQARGAWVCGSDTSEVFYTDTVLRELDIPFFEGFSAGNLPERLDLVIYSAAYKLDTHPELLEAQKKQLPLMTYTQALGAFSAGTDSSGIAGVHGKTTTTALAGTLVKSLGLQGAVLVGSAVSNFNNRSTLNLGTDFFIAETCEYRRHFLDFHPRRLVITSIEMDHQDYFKDLEDLYDAFLSYALRLPEGACLIYCEDDEGCRELVRRFVQRRKDVALIPYGFTAQGPFGIRNLRQEDGVQYFELNEFDRPSLKNLPPFSLKVPGSHLVLDAVAALALVCQLYLDHYGNLSPRILESMAEALQSFRGSRRRSEIVGESQGILFLDDYAHHPTAIKKTLAGYRAFYPGKRLVVDFMSHTWSRTKALLQEFSEAFSDADEVILHEIYPSARETPDPEITGQILYERTAKNHGCVSYFPEVMGAKDKLLDDLKANDVFITMGAGDNWRLGRALLDALKSKEAAS